MTVKPLILWARITSLTHSSTFGTYSPRKSLNEFIKNDKPDLPQETWSLVPDWLRDRQFLFYVESDFEKLFQVGVEVFECNWPRDLPARPPLNPDETSVHGSNHAVYDAACDYAERLAFGEAENLFGALVSRNDRDYADFAAQWIEIIRKYAELLEIASRRSARVILKARVTEYRALFPKMFMDAAIFDPKGLAANEPTPEEIAAEKVKQDRIAREKEEAERIAREKAKKERIPREKTKQQAPISKNVEQENATVDKTKITTLIHALKDENINVRQWAVNELAGIGESAISPLITTLSDEKAWARWESAKVLGKIGDARAVEPLIAALRDSTNHVREKAAEALGNIGDVRAIEPLIVALQDESTLVREKAVEALSKIGDERTVKPLIAALHDFALRGEAANALIKIGKPAVKSLIVTLKDKEWIVRQCAAEALGEIGEASAVEPLIAALKDENEYVRQYAREALERIGTPKAKAALSRKRWPF